MAKTSTSKIRNTLALALERAMAGTLSADDGRNVIGLANQITHSMAVEVKVLTMQHRAGYQVDKFGNLDID